VANAARRAEGYREKVRLFVVRAPVRFICDSADIAVVGGGLMGRLLAWRATKAGLCVALYDAAGSTGEGSAPWVAAGMITPAAGHESKSRKELGRTG
jgi:NADPH-dependent 2,4-dienoyl-CoA reductase/sulfur reductase-like enzyme